MNHAQLPYILYESTDANEYYDWGIICHDQHDFMIAKIYLQKAYCMLPTDAKIVRSYANILLALREYDHSLEMFELAFALSQDTDILSGVAICYFHQNKFLKFDEVIMIFLESTHDAKKIFVVLDTIIHGHIPNSFLIPYFEIFLRRFDVLDYCYELSEVLRSYANAQFNEFFDDLFEMVKEKISSIDSISSLAYVYRRLQLTDHCIALHQLIIDRQIASGNPDESIIVSAFENQIAYYLNFEMNYEGLKVATNLYSFNQNQKTFDILHQRVLEEVNFMKFSQSDKKLAEMNIDPLDIQTLVTDAIHLDGEACYKLSHIFFDGHFNSYGLYFLINAAKANHSLAIQELTDIFNDPLWIDPMSEEYTIVQKLLKQNSLA